MQPAVHLEITVPHIHLPLIHEQAGALDAQKEASQQARDGSDKEYSVQVVILPLPIPGQSGTASAVEAEDSGYHARKGNFRLWQRQNIVADGQPFLLRIVRRWFSASTRQTRTGAPERVDDELVLAISYRHPGAEKPPAVEIMPGLQQIEIVLDAEQLPLSCNVDGTQI